VAFQYQQVESGSATLKQGKSATIGIEDSTGLFGTRYTFNGSPAVVTNLQALVFTPLLPMHPAPGLRIANGPLAGQTQVQVSGEPRQPVTLWTSTNLTSWSVLSSNLLPASGLGGVMDTNISAAQKFFRAATGPFQP